MADETKRTRANVPPMPEYELKSYEPVEFTMPKLRVTDEQVEAKMLEFAESMGGDFKPTKRKVVGPKEHIEIAIEVDKDGSPIPNLCSEKRLYSLGENLMPIDFDRGVLGMKVGETKEFDFKAPDFDAEDQAERPFHAKVTVKTIMRKAEPNITDEWVKKFMPLYKDAADFKEQTRKALLAEAERMIENEKNQQSAYALAERFEGKIDDYWYETTRTDLRRSYEEQAKAQHMDLEDMLGKQGIDEQQFSMMLMLQTREMLRQGFALDAWARHYGLEPSEEDVQALAEMMAPGHGKEMLKKLEEDDDELQLEGFRIAARRYVANKDVTAKAKITYEEPVAAPTGSNAPTAQ